MNPSGSGVGEVETVDELLPPSAVPKADYAVKKKESEPESVALAKQRNEIIKFTLIIASSTILSVMIGNFLIDAYAISPPEDKSKIITGLIAILSTSLGVFVGKRL